MYAQRHAPRRVNRGSLSLSVGLVGTLVGAAMLSSPVVRHVLPDPPIHIYAVPPVTPPPPDPQPRPHPQQKVRPTLQVDRPTPQIITEPKAPFVGPPDKPTIIEPGTLDGTGDAGIAVDPPKPPPVLTAVGMDERYLRDFQPVYPASERRAGNEGAVIVKILVGVDGRVRQAIQIATPSEDFWRATERQALAKWRFKPATRDGIPVEGWRVMTVRFRLEE